MKEVEQLDRAEELGLWMLEAQDKFEYFILGAILAAIAYLAQTNPYAPLGENRETFLLISLLYFVASAGCSLMRLQWTITVLRMNTRALSLHSAGETDKASKLLFRARRESRKARYWVMGRSACLMSAIVIYIVTKVAASYYCQGCMPRLPV